MGSLLRSVLIIMPNGAIFSVGATSCQCLEVASIWCNSSVLPWRQWILMSILGSALKIMTNRASQLCSEYSDSREHISMMIWRNTAICVYNVQSGSNDRGYLHVSHWKLIITNEICHFNLQVVDSPLSSFPSTLYELPLSLPPSQMNTDFRP